MIAGVLFPIPFIIGLILDICWIPLAIVGMPTFLVFVLSTKLVSRYHNKQQAMLRIQEIIDENKRLVGD